MHRRTRLVTLAAVLVLACTCAPARAAGLGGWDVPQQRAVERAGLLAPLDDGVFHGERPLTAPQLRAGLDTMALVLGVRRVPAPSAGHISVAAFDRLVVDQLGLSDVAAAVQSQAFRAGLQPPHRFGGEVVARLLGLRFNHPFADEWRELYPWQPITRAEAAWSLSRLLTFDGEQVAWVRETLARFVLPPVTGAPLRALRIAVSKIGMPYIWGGETDVASGYFGGQVRGGYDCSGFAWRVFKLSGLPAGRRLVGRTAAQQAGGIAGPRLRLDAVRPGDLLFFGPGRFWQRATERRIVHEGIALSPDFMIHASAQGVYVSPLFDPWRAKRFSWAKRIL
jgi:cell wall-associated NlpC family hydrolase